MRLDWQRRAVILFAASLLILCVVLVSFGLREVEREKLLLEKENQAARQRLVESIDGRAKSLVVEAEALVLATAEQIRGRSPSDEGSAEWRSLLSETPLISELLLVDHEGQVVFLGPKPHYQIPGEKTRGRDIRGVPGTDGRWERAEAEEFRTGDLARASRLYRQIAASASEPTLVALALNRLARCYARSGEHESALATYRQQLGMGLSDITAEGIPLEVSALYQIGNISALRGDAAGASSAYLDLYQGLLDAKWPLSRSQFDSLRALADERLRTIQSGLDGSVQPAHEARLEELRKAEKAELARTAILENIGERIIPRIKLEAREAQAGHREPLRLAETTDSGLLLASFVPWNSVSLGLVFEPRALAEGLFSHDSGAADTATGWAAVVVDAAGSVVAGQVPGEPTATEGGRDPRQVFTAGFSDGFPPWTIDIRRSGSDDAERPFFLRKAISVLSLVAVIAALFFGGFLAIRSTAKELKLAKLKSDFTATVSHEFRTPLTSIRYMAELLQRGRVRDEARRQEYYETITNESERLGRLVENLLDFSKIEAGGKEYRMEETDIAVLAADLAAHFRQQAVFKEFTLETEIADGLPVIRADKEALSRAVFNLLDNAVKYSGGDRRVALRVWAASESLHFQVEDRGIGIAKSEQKKVFEKFHRAAGATESDVKGSGIGLTLVEHVVRAHGGMVHLESAPGKGTSVTIKIPLGPAGPGKGDENG
jgi:signal transduction histidine kinase